jgi:hypothetical protein
MNRTPEQEAYRIKRVKEAFAKMGPRPKQWRENQSKGIKKTFQDPAYRKKFSDQAKKQNAEGKFGHDQAFMDRLKKRMSKEGRKPENLRKLDKARKKANAKLKGSNQFGRAQRGRPDHPSCKFWSIRSPAGSTYHFSNLREFCRSHIHLFEDPYPEALSPLWHRAAQGIAALNQKHGKSCSWAGWTLISKSEGNPDPLSRSLAVQEETR